MIDEGYTKFRVDWKEREPLDGPLVHELDRWRRELHAAGLVGHYEELGVGYGNLSVREDSGFIISGTQTGHIVDTGPEHYARVTGVDIAANRVTCTGPVQASSESMTHAAIYAASPEVYSIVHAHDHGVWSDSLGAQPTTSADIPYGTPEMADEFARLLRESEFASNGLAVMGGHEGGLIAIGASIHEAATRMLEFALQMRRNGC